MTQPWPPPTPPRAPVRRSRGGPVAAVVAAILASQLFTVIGVGSLAPQLRASDPTSTRTARPTPSTTAPQPIESRLLPLPEQTVAPVDVTAELERGVVLISGSVGNRPVAGTGMVLTPEGQVLTNYHVVRSTDALQVTIAATGRRHYATLVGRDATADVALLQLQGVVNLDTVTIDTDPVRVGDVVIAAGNARGQGYVSANRGNILGMGRSIQVQGADDEPPEPLDGLIETNAPAWPGDSGGPMFDAQAEVLGMTTAGSSPDIEGEVPDDRSVYAVPIAQALAVVEQIRAGDESGTVVIGPKPYLGVTAMSNTGDSLVVRDVMNGAPASQTSLASGDTITALGGHRVRNRADLVRALDAHQPGDTVDLTWRTPRGQERTEPVTLAASEVN